VLEVLSELAEDGPTEKELDDLHRRADRVPTDDPDALRSALDFAATEELIGGDPLDAEELRRQRRAATPEDLRAAFAEAYASRLVIVPDSCPRPGEGLADLERPVTRFDGRVHEDREAPKGDLLIVDDAGVYWFDGKQAEVSIPAAEVAFVARRAAGVLCVYGLDSSWIEIDPRRLTDGAEAAETVARLAGGAERIVPAEPEGAAAVEELAKGSLDRLWEVSDELDVLPDALHPGEVPRTLARGARGAKSGLLVLTDRRLLFLSKKPTGEDFVELPLADLDRAEARSSLLGGTKLRVAYEGDRIEFKGIEPKERAGEIAEEIADAD
jgi:hypothetical protein